MTKQFDDQQTAQVKLGAFGQNNALANIPPTVFGAANAQMRPVEQYTFTAGRLVRKSFRQLLEQKQFEGLPILWIEKKRFVESSFVVRGLHRDIAEVRDAVSKKVEALNRA